MKRIAIFGAGKMAMHHIRAINLMKDAQVVGVADPVADENKLKGLLPEGCHVFNDPKELLRTIRPDVVHICTPPETHSALATLVLKKGSHVYVEKPFALSSNEAAEVISLANQSGLKVCAGHQLLFEPHMSKVNDQISKLGKIVCVESYFSFKTVRQSSDGSATISPIDQLIDIMPHPVYLLLYFIRLNKLYQEDTSIKIKALDITVDGNVNGIFRCGDTTGILRVTLQGRPIESFVKVVGTNGCLFAEYVRGTVVTLPGPGTSGISKVLNPYSEALQNTIETTVALSRRVFKKQRSYPGLYEIFSAFYDSLDLNSNGALSGLSIVETVSICEEIAAKLKLKEKEEDNMAEEKLLEISLTLPKPDIKGGKVLVTGGSGLLGLAVVKELRKHNRDILVISRKNQPFSKRVPGVKYLVADLGSDVPAEILQDVGIVVHCAAETVGGKDAHARNTINATRNLLDAMATAGVRKMVHISSIAVLKTSRDYGSSIDEYAGIEPELEGRGPYVWGKGEAEKLVMESEKKFGITSKIIRPGPLVDYNAFTPPGRLGREVGRMFIYIGKKNERLSLCDVQTAAEVIRMYVIDFISMPPILNLIEPNAPTRGELVSLLLNIRPDLRAVRIPAAFIWSGSTVMKLLQRVLRPRRKPLDIYAAFASEKYNSSLASKIIEKSKIQMEQSA